jgi:predicted Fe-Mo cluster-binding NifX family protein
MKIAVATNEQQKRVMGHLGRCRYFLIYDTNESGIVGKEIRENTFTHHMAHGGEHHQHHGEGHGHSHTALVDALKDCKYIIFQSGGWRIIEDLKAGNITPVLTDESIADEAVEKFLKGELEEKEDGACHHN